MIKRVPCPILLGLILSLSIAQGVLATPGDDHEAEGGEHHSHVGHSDALLYLLQHKIAIQKLQAAYPKSNTEEQRRNLKKQQARFDKIWPILQQYLSIPEARYPNNEMYHQSLISRGALLAEFGLLFQQYATLSPSP